MTAAVLQLICTGAAAVAAVVWALLSMRLGRTVRDGAHGSTRTVTPLLAAAAVVLLAVRGAATAALWAASVAFVSDRLWGLSLSAAMTTVAVVAIARRWPVASALAGGAAIAAGAELVLTLVVGAPVPVWAGVLVVVGVVVGATAWTGARLRWGRRPAAATIATGAVAVLALAAVGWTGIVGPGALGAEGFQAHAHAGSAPAGSAQAESDIRPPRTAVTALAAEVDPGAPRVEVQLRAQQQKVGLPSGDDVEAWTFGALAGPAITATVGDVLAVRLDNVDIAGGVTAHWHGYPVPAAADGVAGVTQDAVAPGARSARHSCSTGPERTGITRISSARKGSSVACTARSSCFPVPARSPTSTSCCRCTRSGAPSCSARTPLLSTRERSAGRPCGCDS